MFKEGTKLISILCIVLPVLLAGFLIYMIYTDNRQQKAQSETLEELIAEAEPYEAEQQELKSRLTFLQNSIYYSSDTAEIMVGFVVSDISDISYMEEKAAAYRFSPVLIIDCTLDMEFIEEVIEKTDESQEIMLYASNFSAETNKSVLSVISYLDSVNRKHCGVFLLRGDYCTDSNIQLLIDDGFIGYTIYNSESPKSGQTDDGSVYFDYSYLTSAGTSVTSRIAAQYMNKASLILAFDMASVNSGVLMDIYVTSLLDRVQTYMENDDFTFSTVASVVDELSKINMTEEERQAEYETEIEQIQERIDELDEIIHDIYAKFDAR